ncbi:hypothetical protein GUJ93_ZPchr0009g1305 [Zizania palustris]|uniref:Uncharacterized protein n=1 Tax=Zizania palustris TaxID=103762 RepID=A0A8J5V940_ZIZPA|nr:hypothetical protein GUJ93_ZPchr0009g1305 [Zizania palustris]
MAGRDFDHRYFGDFFLLPPWMSLPMPEVPSPTSQPLLLQPLAAEPRSTELPNLWSSPLQSLSYFGENGG